MRTIPVTDNEAFMTSVLRYYDRQKEMRTKAEIEAEAARPAARHFDFLMERNKDDKKIELPQREHVSSSDVGLMTETMLNAKAGIYFEQLNTWRPDLQFRREKQCKIIEGMPHLGYSSITSGTIPDENEDIMPWMLYFANFNAKFGTGDVLFEDIPKNYGFTLFALALQLNDEGIVIGRDLRKRGNGLLFATKDPAKAFTSIAKLREVQILWQMETKKREKNAQITGKMPTEPKTRNDIELPKVATPGPEDHLNLIFTL
jgi:hypothetical protein